MLHLSFVAQEHTGTGFIRLLAGKLTILNGQIFPDSQRGERSGLVKHTPVGICIQDSSIACRIGERSIPTTDDVHAFFHREVAIVRAGLHFECITGRRSINSRLEFGAGLVRSYLNNCSLCRESTHQADKHRSVKILHDIKNFNCLLFVRIDIHLGVAIYMITEVGRETKHIEDVP